MVLCVCCYKKDLRQEKGNRHSCEGQLTHLAEIDTLNGELDETSSFSIRVDGMTGEED